MSASALGFVSGVTAATAKRKTAATNGRRRRGTPRATAAPPTTGVHTTSVASAPHEAEASNPLERELEVCHLSMLQIGKLLGEVTLRIEAMMQRGLCVGDASGVPIEMVEAADADASCAADDELAASVASVDAPCDARDELADDDDASEVTPWEGGNDEPSFVSDSKDAADCILDASSAKPLCCGDTHAPTDQCTDSTM